GNPVRNELMQMEPVADRYARRTGPLRLLGIGGSLGASMLNTVIPQALALIPAGRRREVRPQSRTRHSGLLEDTSRQVGVTAQCVDFIDDMAQALGWADLIVCRAGAMTVAEVSVAGVAALFVPLPHAIDDQQSANARYLADDHGAWLCKQTD